MAGGCQMPGPWERAPVGETGENVRAPLRSRRSSRLFFRSVGFLLPVPGRTPSSWRPLSSFKWTELILSGHLSSPSIHYKFFSVF